MSDNDNSPTAADIAAIFAYAGLPVPAERLATHHETYAESLALIRQASVSGLGETVPAVGFKADWD